MVATVAVNANTRLDGVQITGSAASTLDAAALAGMRSGNSYTIPMGTLDFTIPGTQSFHIAVSQYTQLSNGAVSAGPSASLSVTTRIVDSVVLNTAAFTEDAVAGTQTYSGSVVWNDTGTDALPVSIDVNGTTVATVTGVSGTAFSGTFAALTAPYLAVANVTFPMWTVSVSGASTNISSNIGGAASGEVTLTLP